MKILVANGADRDQMVVILDRNGYTVRVFKDKAPGKSTYQYGVKIVEPRKEADVP